MENGVNDPTWSHGWQRNGIVGGCHSSPVNRTNVPDEIQGDELSVHRAPINNGVAGRRLPRINVYAATGVEARQCRRWYVSESRWGWWQQQRPPRGVKWRNKEAEQCAGCRAVRISVEMRRISREPAEPNRIMCVVSNNTLQQRITCGHARQRQTVIRPTTYGNAGVCA